MKKYIIIGFGVIALIVVIAIAYLDYRGKSLSPSGLTELSAGDLKVSVSYGRPSARGRVIFGTEAQKALQPYGKYWRLGANDATEITFSKNVAFNGMDISAGTYRMYAVPGAESFAINLNSEAGKWGLPEPDYSKDLLKTNVPVQKPQAPVEQFTVSMTESDGGILVYFEWDNVQLVIPVTAQ